MPKNKVLSLNQKAQICEASLAPGFDKEHCIKKFEISRSCLNRILRNKDQFMTFFDIASVHELCHAVLIYIIYIYVTEL